MTTQFLNLQIFWSKALLGHQTSAGLGLTASLVSTSLDRQVTQMNAALEASGMADMQFRVAAPHGIQPVSVRERIDGQIRSLWDIHEELLRHWHGSFVQPDSTIACHATASRADVVVLVLRETAAGMGAATILNKDEGIALTDSANLAGAASSFDAALHTRRTLQHELGHLLGLYHDDGDLVEPPGTSSGHKHAQGSVGQGGPFVSVSQVAPSHVPVSQAQALDPVQAPHTPIGTLMRANVSSRALRFNVVDAANPANAGNASNGPKILPDDVRTRATIIGTYSNLRPYAL